MDVDGDNIHKYDDFVRGPAREVITVETKIKPTNKGFAMLAKLGWVEGQPIGLSNDGTCLNLTLRWGFRPELFYLKTIRPH